MEMVLSKRERHCESNCKTTMTMKRVRRNETITTSKKRDESDGNDLFSLLPLDLKKEIILKLPPKSLAELILASKLWSSILRGKDFTELYRTRSSFRPRFLFAVKEGGMQFFQSCSQEEDPSAEHHHRVSITRNLNSQHGICCHGGLISYRYPCTRVVVIGNPFTGQFITLPRVEARRNGIFTFFGYDPVNEVYKVLCMTVKNVFPRRRTRTQVVSEEHQVYTLGAQEQKWRMIICKHPHRPCRYFKGLCKNGVVYYFAWINGTEKSLISFNLRSEDFNVIKLPEDVELLNLPNLVRYNGKIALTSCSCNGTLNLRVLEDARKHEWSKLSILVPSWTDLVGDTSFRFKGSTSFGELIFAPYNIFPNPSYILCYDLMENKARKVYIEGTRDGGNSAFEVFFDHYESPMILPNLS